MAGYDEDAKFGDMFMGVSIIALAALFFSLGFVVSWWLAVAVLGVVVAAVMVYVIYEIRRQG